MLKKLSLDLFLLSALLSGLPTNARADEDIWNSGINLYVRLTEQDEAAGGTPPPNQHPVALNTQEITSALKSLEVWDKKSFFQGIFRKSEEPVTVFSAGQAAILGANIAAGLQKAGPREDIVFAVARNESGFMHIRDTSYTAGRAFYANDRLNIIIGDFEKPPDRFQERAVQSSGVAELKYYFAHGKRAKPSGFDQAIVSGPGVSVYQDQGKVRLDWLVVDVPVASAAYIARQENAAETAPAASTEAIRREAQKLAEERREMRLEMARMRKEMKEQSGGADGRSIEERMATLNALYEKELISREEYEAKRRELLEQL